MSQDPKTEEKIVEEKAGEEEKTNADAPGDEIKKSVKRDEVNEGKKSSKTSDVQEDKKTPKKGSKKEEKAEEKQKEKENQQGKQLRERKTTSKKVVDEEDDEEEEKSASEDDYKPEKQESKKAKKQAEGESDTDEEKQVKQPGKRGRKPGVSNKKSKINEEVSRPSTSTKRIRYDNREFYKNELKTREFPSLEKVTEEVNDFISKLEDREKFDKETIAELYGTIDLTSLNSTDGYEFIDDWLLKSLIQVEKEHQVKPAAICVYPIFAKLVKKKIKALKSVKTAVVSTCFPTGQTFLEVKVQETKIAVREGADEIDMVVSRGLWNEGEELNVLEEVFETKKACNQALLKVILENCDLKGLDSIYKLSFLSLCAGGDFIKTSTGKGKHGAKLEEFGAMCLALRDFMKGRDKNEVRGIKAAGGVGDAKTAYKFYQLFENITGLKPTPENFRIGASSLCKNLVKDLQDLK